MGSPLKKIAAFGLDRRLGFFDGAAMAATIETVEGELVPGERAFIRAVRPLVDGGAPRISLGRRNRLNDPLEWSQPVIQGPDGECKMRSLARYHRARIHLDAGDQWSHALGIDVDATGGGGR